MSMTALPARILFAACLLLTNMVTAYASIDVAYFHKSYSGKIADKYAFTMDLKSLDGKLIGTYQYTGKTKRNIYLQGTINVDGTFTMDESDGMKSTGRFVGKLDNIQISGNWQSTDGRKNWPFVATQTSEIQIGTKKEILTKAIGDYPLANISGSGGANGMWDTWKEKGGRWQSNVSGISNGMREANTIKLTKSDIHLLNSMRVSVAADLSTRLSVGGKIIFTIPYRDNGMQYAVNASHNSIIEDNLKKYSDRTTVLDERLYLLVEDGVDYSNVISGNFEAAVSDILTVSYSVLDRDFELTFTEGDCCGSTTFKFSRPH